MHDKTNANIVAHFGHIEDPRRTYVNDHPLINIITIVLCAVIADAEGWSDVELFGQQKKTWLSRFLDLENGIPSHDTFGRVFARLDPEQFQQSFLSWVQAVFAVTCGQVIALDGKAVRRSHDKGVGKHAIRMISAWATVIVQTKMDRVFIHKENNRQQKEGTGFNQPKRPHQHWHIDITYINICGTFYYLCTILDGYSRYIVHWEIRSAMTEADVETVLQRARENFPEAQPRIISDNGPQFIARDFKQFIRLCGMQHVRTSPYYPETISKRGQSQPSCDNQAQCR
jgi:hypothetical protein